MYVISGSSSPVVETPATLSQPSSHFKTSPTESLRRQVRFSGEPVQQPQFSTPCVQSSSSISIPPDVHKVVVEHVVRNVASNHHRLRVFSGNLPKPSNEVNYEVWRLQAQQLIKDPDLSDNEKRRKLLDSLMPSALNTALHLGDSASASEYFEELEKAFGNVADGEELYTQWLETHQNKGEKSSDYLKRLNELLQAVKERGSIGSKRSEHVLLKQFIRGCWEEKLISDLRLSELLSAKDNSITYGGLLFMVRSAERERDFKEDRRKRYLGVQQVKVSSKSHCTVPDSSSSDAQDSPVQLQQKVAQLERKLADMHAKAHHSVPTTMAMTTGKEEIKYLPTSVEHQHSTPLAGKSFSFCYNCGEDGHHLGQCNNETNAILVQQKLCKRSKHRNTKFNSSQPSSPMSLNM
ncbi:paraneoplastic antigen Ma3-like [Huso huso]|uniref:Paraneoplastic antigen Ma3-like n=1 Tax=Huso huso TaxID=61971 RepID=A0ABR1AB62_HUSHU